MRHVFGVDLYAWQVDVLREIGTLPRARRAYVQIGRKNGKSLLGAAMVLTELVLIPESAVYAISDSERNLNSVLMRELRTLIGRSRAADAAFVVTAGGIEYPGNGSFLEMRHGKFSATQGINPTLVIMDEVHLQKSDEIWSGMLMAGAACRHFLLLGITTPGYDLSSFAHELYQLARSGSDPDLYSRVFEPDDLECGLEDRAAWAQSNPRLEDDPDFLFAMESDHRALPEHEFRRFRLGIWTATESAWLPYGAWAKCAGGEAFGPGDPDVWLGFDGSFSGDSTALVAARGTHVQVAGAWENPGRTGWRVPRGEVETTIAVWMDANRKTRLLVDPPYWTREISEWQQRWPGRVLEFPTHVRARMAPACTAFYAAVLDGSLTHDGDKRLARHVSNAIVKSSPQGDYITKPDPRSPAKIDLAVAAVVAFSAASAAARRRSPAGVF
jgi:phage terminase large subunit-like protein